jgi:hypothetical protein
VLAGLVVVLSRRWTFAPCLPFQTFREYLRDTVLPALKDRYDEFLLTELVKRWEHHKIMNKWMFRFFMYLVSGVWYCLCECSPVFGLTRAGAVLRTATIASITTCQLLKNLVRWRVLSQLLLAFLLLCDEWAVAGRTAFREVVFNAVKSKATQAIIDMINKYVASATRDFTAGGGVMVRCLQGARRHAGGPRAAAKVHRNLRSHGRREP